MFLNTSIDVAKPIKSFLKKIPFARSVNSYLWRHNWLRAPDWRDGSTNLNVLLTFPLFRTSATGNYNATSVLAIKTINQIIPTLNTFATSMGLPKVHIADIDTFVKSPEEATAANDLKVYFDKYGSDKAHGHDYHKLYGPILKNRDKIGCVLEIGLGTNNTNITSNMGRDGKPGASLRAFRDFLKQAKIFGADIDRSILFCDDRIQTFFVDQTDPDSFRELALVIPADFDLVIDDGLHAPESNIVTLLFAMAKVKIGGWIVIEDICLDAVPLWELVTSLLSNRYSPHLCKAREGVIFAVQRLA